MAEAAVAAVVLLPLALLTYVAVHLIRLGMTAAELTEAARQRVAGLGMLLLYLVVLLALGVTGTGVYCLLRLREIA